MPAEENKEVMRRFISEVMEKKNPAAVDEFIAADYIEHSPIPGFAEGVEGMKQMMGMFFGAFPDLHMQVEDVIAEGDKVVMRLKTEGTHQGEFMGIAATGKQVSFEEIHMMRIANGKMVEHWGIEDNMTMMQQMGIIPS